MGRVRRGYFIGGGVRRERERFLFVSFWFCCKVVVSSFGDVWG